MLRSTELTCRGSGSFAPEPDSCYGRFVSSRSSKRREHAGVPPMPDPRAPSLWGLERDSGGALSRGAHRLAELIATYGSPLHVADAGAIDRNAEAAMAPLRAGHGADVFSSYKTNPVPVVLDRLHRQGIGAEAISPYELWLALELGVPGERIIFNGPGKSDESLRVATVAGAALVNANSPGDLAAMASAATDVGRPMNAGIRVSLPHMWGGQFGFGGSSSDLLEAIRFARRATSLDLIGLHFHSGFPLSDMATLRAHLDAVLRCCDRIRSETEWHPSVLDLGGSLRCATVFAGATDASATLSIAEASAAMSEIVTEHMHRAGVRPPDLMIEPGRSLTADTQLMLATVIDTLPPVEGLHTVVIDVGTELAEPARSENHRLFAVTDPGTPPVPTRLVGPRGTIDDVLIDATMLPILSPGDHVAIMDTGAYFVPFSTASSFPRPAIVMIDGAEVTVARARETTTHRTRLDRV